MADNVAAPFAGTAGPTFATDQDSGTLAHYVIQKIAFGPLDTFTLASLTNGFPVQPATSATWVLGAGTNDVGKFRFSLPSSSALTEVIINQSASGDTTLVSATSSLVTRLYSVFLVVAGITNLTFKDGSTALTGAMPFVANQGMALDLRAEPWFTGTANTAFILNSSQAVQVSGRMYYLKS